MRLRQGAGQDHRPRRQADAARAEAVYQPSEHVQGIAPPGAAVGRYGGATVHPQIDRGDCQVAVAPVGDLRPDHRTAAVAAVGDLAEVVRLQGVARLREVERCQQLAHLC